MISKSVPLVVAASLLLSCRDAATNPNDDQINQWEPVVAVFPDIGTIATEFTFTAFAILDSDTVSIAGGYQARWDFDNDGVHDTAWLDSLTAGHTFDGLGKHVVRVALRDSAGLERDTTSRAYVQALIQITLNESGSGQGNIDWSRDGSDRIAFDWRGPEGGVHQIWVVAYPEGEPVQLTFDPDPDIYYAAHFPEWSPDDRYIAFSSSNGVERVDIHTGSVEQIFDRIAYNLRWSPDGRWLLHSLGGGIGLYDFESDSYEQFVDTAYSYCWSPSGDKVAYSSERVNGILAIVEFPSGNPVASYQLPEYEERMDWSPDGRWLSLEGESNGVNPNVFRVLRVETGKIFTGQVSEMDIIWWPSWSEDGTLLAFDAMETGSGRRSDIWAITFPQDLE